MSGDGDSFFSTVRGQLLTSVPVASVLVFLSVAIKVFRASRMETSTTVAIVSTANDVELLKGVVVTLLPGFIAGAVAAGLWWWAGSVPTERASRATARQALLNPRFWAAWALLAVAFCTVAWPFFVLVFLPMLWLSARLLGAAWSRSPTAETRTRWPRLAVRTLGVTSFVVSIGLLSLSPTVWLPLRDIEVVDDTAVDAKGAPLDERFAAYVLHSDDQRVNLLLESPRVVLELRSDQIAPTPPICIPEPSGVRPWLLRASQRIGLEQDPGSPYRFCPK